MKILILTNNAGGLYSFRKELLIALKEQGDQVYVSVPDEDGYHDVESLVYRIAPISLNRRGMNPIEDLKLICDYKILIKTVKPDCVLTYTIKPNIYGAIVAQLYKIPYLVNVTGLGTALEKDNIMRKVLIRLYKASINKARCVFYQNNYNQRMLEQFGAFNSNTVLLPGSGVNLSSNNIEPYPLNSSIIKFLFVARVMTDKGINEFIEASRILKKKYDNFEFHVVGMCEDGYGNKIKAWDKEQLIIYHGPQRDMHKCYKYCHCLVHPSYHEGLSNVCLEAAATGRPILASNIPGCKETFIDGVTGISFEPRNVDSLVRAIEKFMALNNDERALMGKMGREKIEKEFDRKIVVKAYIEQIEKIERDF